MCMKKSIYFCIALICFMNTNAIGQKGEQVDLNIVRAFINNVTANGGTWIAENNQFDKQNKEGFPFFIMSFKKDDDLSVRGKILGVNTENDTIVFWEIWEFVDVTTGKSKQVQRGPTGNYGFGGSTYVSNVIRKGELHFNFIDGSESKHKSSHIFLDDNTMLSESENYDAKAQQWVKSPPQKWIRKI